MMLRLSIRLRQTGLLTPRRGAVGEGSNPVSTVTDDVPALESEVT